MARYPSLWPKPYLIDSPIVLGVQAYDEFMRDPNGGIAWSLFSVRDPDEERTDCLLDSVYAWLVEGNAVEVCPTYEHYVLSVIGIIDEYSAWLRQPTDDAEGFAVFNWGKAVRREDGTLDPEEAERPRHQLYLDISAAPQGYAHPALSKQVYEMHRALFVDGTYALIRQDHENK